MEPITRFDQMTRLMRRTPPVRVAVAAGHDEDTIRSLGRAAKESVARGVLYADRKRAESVIRAAGEDPSSFEIQHVPDPVKAAEAAVRSVSGGSNQVLMKGQIHTDDFLRAVLNREWGLRDSQLLSHCFILEAVHLGRLLFVTDAAVNIAPNFEKKAVIARNAIALAREFGIERPKVAALAAVELVDPDMPATQDAALLALMSVRGQFKYGVVDGPFALDNAVSERAARIKGISNEVAGRADILLVPDIEAGNMLAKAFAYISGGQIAGIVLGAKAPIVLTSRADTDDAKFHSLVAAAYTSQIEMGLVKVGRHR